MRIEPLHLVLVMLALVVALVFAGLQFQGARQDIARYGAEAVEKCKLLKCDVGPLGQLDCRLSPIPDVDIFGFPELGNFSLSREVSP